MSADDLYEGSLHREAERGAEKISFKVPGGRSDELCVVPQHLPFAKHRGKDGALLLTGRESNAIVAAELSADASTWRVLLRAPTGEFFDHASGYGPGGAPFVLIANRARVDGCLVIEFTEHRR